ncbi:hypothetical protein CDN99_25180 [Roseateles aquatilis]|uniref:Uncharacterized protein n=1 Tax=Roseateles aquatilis TaxID=431061 RepID=A0A246IUF1_9BURK|nr:hypothetical protein CDN99_25180 [Roseateles aquatilis]
MALAAGLLLASPAWASPGAHGPNGEHLDGPAAAVAGSGAPRVEAFSESFEIVGRLEAAGLVLYISRYETSEAVLNAKVEVEVGGVKAPAVFESEPGSYRVSDKRLLDALRASGRHALLFTVTAGADSDLLDGPMAVASDAGHADAHHDGSPIGLRGGLALAGGGLLSLALVVALRRRNRQ